MIAQHARPMYDQRKWAMGKIHEVAARLGMDDPTRYAFQVDLVGVQSCKDMDVRQLKQVLYALTHKSGSPLRAAATSKSKQYVLRAGAQPCARTGRDERQPDELATIEQTRMIDALFADIEVQNPGRLPGTWRTAFCKRQVRCVWPQTRAQANKIIEALKAMRARGWHPKEHHAQA